jgi:hypothetical protein
MALLLVPAACVFACSAACTRSDEVSSAKAARPAPTASPTTAPPAGPQQFTLAVAGDVHFTGRTATLLGDPATAFGPMATLLRGADLALVNLETAVTERGEPEPKEFHFRAPATAYAAVKAAGVDAVSLANNHVLDYGQVGLADTLSSAAASQLPVFGAGRDATAAYAPWITTVRGTRVAVLGFSQIHDLEQTWIARDDRAGVALALDVAKVRAAVAQAKAQADVVIAFNHWGREGVGCPSQEQKQFLSVLISAGVDVVLGAHAHTLQGLGWSGRTFVSYGLGNFVWYGNSYSTETGVLQLTIRGRDVTGWTFVPAVVSESGQPVQLTGDAAERLSNRVAGLRECAGLAIGPA